MELVSKNNYFGTYLAMFLLGTILLFFRSAYNFITPFLFNEDGVWFAQLIDNGFIHTFFHQRYFMTGYLLLEEISIWINKLLFGYNLRYLAQIIAAVTYSFHSLVALITFICLRQNLKTFPRCLIWLMILLMPMGHSGYDVFGKICGYGYIFYFIALVLTFYLIFNVTSNTGKIKLIAIFLTLWVCSTTNSASNVIIAVGFCTDILMQFLKSRKCSNYPNVFCYLRNLFGTFKNIMWVVLGVVCIICFLYQAFAMQLLNSSSCIPHIIKHENIIEFFGRAILFYFTWPFYSDLNDIYVILMLCLYFALILAAAVVTSKEKRVEVLYLSAGALIIAAATFAMRPGLTYFLHSYQSSFPDRYYYVINICAMLSVVYAASCFNRSMTLKFCKFYIYALLVIPVYYSSLLFEFDKFYSRFPFDSFLVEIFKGQRQPNGFYKVETSSISSKSLRFIELPENYVLSTMINSRDYRSAKNIHKCYAMLNNDTLHVFYDGYEDNLWFAIWSSYKGQDDLVWVKASKECKLGTFCHDLELSSEKLLESPYHIHFYKGSDSPEKFLCAFDTPAR